MRTHLLAVAAGFATISSAFTCSGNYFSFFNRDGTALSYQRLDPALYPGTQSPHLHSFDGGNSLTANADFAQMQSSSCSTARIKPDKSLYWRPTLFWNGNGTGFYRVPEKQSKIYYKFGDAGAWAQVEEFPGNFNMIAGYPLKRAEGDNPAGVRWGCHQPDGRSDPLFSDGFPTGFQSCDYGFASEVTFPSCWNGEALDPKNPNAHIAYPTGGGVGTAACPETHRKARFPTIFIEFWYDISSFKGQWAADKSPWVLSNGDPTGYGFHADFLNGWEKGVLAKATAETGGCYCGCGCGQAEMEQCFGADNVNKNDDTEFKQCSADISIANADANKVLDKLPGCNPLQYGPASATVVTGTGCDATAVPPSGGSKSAAASTSALAASKTPAAGASSGKASSQPAHSAKSSAQSSILKEGIASSAAPSLSLSVPNKQYGTPSAVAPSKSNNTPAASTAAASSSPTAALQPSRAPADGSCKPPVYVTVTPTYYVTLGAQANTTACALGTVYTTLTERVTVTVAAAGGSY